MDTFQNIGIKDYFKRYGYRYGIQRGLFTASPIHVVKDYENKKILYYHKVREKIKKKYLNAAMRDPHELYFADFKVENPIWVYWKQGLDTAPSIVKACIQSVIKNVDSKVIVLTDNNLKDYILFPKYIIEKLQSGKMSFAAFSDLLRFSLLEHFGGVWIDATVYLTGGLPEYITNSEFFAYKDVFGLIENPALISNWLLQCKPHNIVMRKTRNISFEYWRKENYVMEYLLSYIILTIVFEEHQEEFLKVPYVNSDYSHLMLNILGKKYNESEYKHIKSLSNIHKLSYKLNKNIYNNQQNLYHKIIGKMENE